MTVRSLELGCITEQEFVLALLANTLISPSCRTIIYLSIVYAIGQVVMAVSAIHDITDTDRDGTPDNLTLHM